MNQPTKRPAHWRPVERGERVAIACEGGYVNEPAPEDGFLLRVEGDHGIYVPLSLAESVVEHLKKPAPKRRQKAGKR